MNVNVKVVKCINPTGTLTKDKSYNIIEHRSFGNILIRNDYGKTIQVGADRFIEVKGGKVEEVVKEKNSLKCIDSGNFKNLTTNKEYIVESKTREFVNVKNDAGSIRRYASKYFEKQKIADIAKKREPAKKNPAIPAGAKVVECIHPRAGITFAKKYAIIKEEESHYTIKNDTGSEARILKTRFRG